MRNRGTAALLCLTLSLFAQASPTQADESGTRLTLDASTRERCLTTLRAGFASDEFWPSMHAAEALSRAGHGADVRRRLEPMLPKETDAQHRCGLARELVRAGDLSFTQTLLDTLRSPDPYGHVHACESLFKVNEIGDGALIRAAASRTKQPKLAIMASAALARWGSPSAMATLRRLLTHEDGEIARVAAWVVARVGDRSDIPALRQGHARFSDPLTKAYFAHALATLGDAEGHRALLANLSHSDFNVRVYAAEFAPEARALDAKDALLRLLDDPVLDVRIRAADALLRLEQPAPRDRRADFAREVFPATAANPRYSEGSVLPLRDGRLLYATTEFAGSGSDFASARVIAVESHDDGAIWSERKVLQENVGKQNVMSVTLRRIGVNTSFAGPIGFFYLVKNSYTDLVVDLRLSNDEGKTFTEPTRVTREPGYHVLNNDRVAQLRSGRLVVPVASTADVTRENRFACSCYLSDDGGKTWRRSRNSVPYARRGAMEPEVLELNDGRLLMHIRTQLGHLAYSTSTDGGETWSEAADWKVRGPESPATLRRIPSTGDLVLIWNDIFREGESHGGKRTPLTAAISSDEGQTWKLKRDLETDRDHTYAYTSVLFHHGRALLTYYVRDERSGRISSRFRSVPIGWFYDSAEGRKP